MVVAALPVYTFAECLLSLLLPGHGCGRVGFEHVFSCARVLLCLTPPPGPPHPSQTVVWVGIRSLFDLYCMSLRFDLIQVLK